MQVRPQPLMLRLVHVQMHPQPALQRLVLVSTHLQLLMLLRSVLA